MLKLAKRFKLELAEMLEIKPRYNLAPSEDAPMTWLRENRSLGKVLNE